MASAWALDMTAAAAVFNGSSIGRLLLSVGLGSVIGAERELARKPAGLRTNIFLCLGTCFFTILPAVLAGPNNQDHSRVASNIVQGIGFLGGGLILHQSNRVVGLTGASTIFVVASIGMACGAGQYVGAVFATVLVVFCMSLLGAMEDWLNWKRYTVLYEVRGADRERLLECLLACADAQQRRLPELSLESLGGIERVSFSLLLHRYDHERMLRQLETASCIDAVKTYRSPENE